jgi:voltage-gated potassium channel
MRRVLRHLRQLPRYLWRKVRRVVPRPVLRSLAIMSALVVVGTVGYPLIEGGPWGLFDGLYMTVITLLTIGYGEIPKELSTGGRAFTMVLAFGGVFTFAYYASEMVRATLTGELQQLLGRQRMEDDLAALTGHLIVCGYGRMGRIICDELERQKKRFVVVDTGPAEADWPYRFGLRLPGNATEDEVLRRAGIDRAKSLITAVGSDADNLYITLSARLINPKLFIVARAEEEEAETKLRKVGANKVISPYLAGGHRAVQAVLRPTVLHFMEMATRPEFLDLQIEEVRVEPFSALAGKSLRESRLSQDLGVIVVGILRPTGEVLYGPRGDVVVEPSATLIVIGQRSRLDQVEVLAGVRPAE